MGTPLRFSIYARTVPSQYPISLDMTCVKRSRQGRRSERNISSRFYYKCAHAFHSEVKRVSQKLLSEYVYPEAPGVASPPFAGALQQPPDPGQPISRLGSRAQKQLRPIRIHFLVVSQPSGSVALCGARAPARS
ncbi:hypothetical protein SBBP2_550005 [Burkholderiales bacterium]|nr:hypothetical protein SBBP2_550005 [Burkholderiales bacterium]